MNDVVTAAVVLLFWLALIVVSTVGWCMIAKRLGYTPLAGLLMLIPGGNFFVFLYWAFSESPNERKIRRLEITSSHHRDKNALSFLSNLEGSGGQGFRDAPGSGG